MEGPYQRAFTRPSNWPLDYWQSKEWLDVQDKLDQMERDGIPYNPRRGNLFRAMRLCSFEACKVAFFGESPYPDPAHATGVAFSSVRRIAVGESTESDPFPESARRSIPASLRVILREYCRDLSLPFPSSGCLEGWCDQGVLLHNVVPTVEYDRTVKGAWKTWSHHAWPEWPPLTREIVERLSAKGGIVFVFLGARAQAFQKYVDPTPEYNSCFHYTHPSPLANRWATSPISGSRLFSKINYELSHVHCKDPIDWRLF